MRLQGKWVVGLGAVTLAVAAGAAAGTYLLRDSLYRGEALPGVHVEQPRLAQPVTVLAGSSTLHLVPGTVLALDPAATRRVALAAGRDTTVRHAEALLLPVPPARTVEPVLLVRASAWSRFVARLDALGRPARAATVAMDGLEPVVTPGRDGTKVDRAALLAALLRHVRTGHSTIAVRYVAARPALDLAAARRAASTASAAVSGPIELRYADSVVGSLAPEQVAPLLRFRPYGGGYVVEVAPLPLADELRPLVAQWHKAPVNARFVVKGARVAVVPSQPGADVDPATSAAAVLSAAVAADSPARVATIALGPTEAKLTTADARALGIRQKLVSYTTEMGPSSSNRIHNVHLMADFIDGTIVRPGELFSYNGVVGPRTAARGFLEGQEIVGSLTIPSIGGGVCQTATTLFNDAFELGLPIVERLNHSYYLSHYPLGRDATVSWGGPDLKFRNDLKHALLIEASYTDSTLTFTVYGTPQGRKIVSTTSPETNFRTPRMSYAVDPRAPRNSVHVVAGSGEAGFDVTVTRSVFQAGKLLRHDTFASHYVAVGPTTVYGPGKTPPGPYLVIPPS